MYWNYGGYGSVSSILSKLQEIKGKIKHDLLSQASESKQGIHSMILPLLLLFMFRFSEASLMIFIGILNPIKAGGGGGCVTETYRHSFTVIVVCCCPDITTDS